MSLSSPKRMSEIVDVMFPIAGYAFRSFVVHKPVGVVSSTVDTGPSELVKKKTSPRYGLPKNSVARKTVYDVASEAGFPTDCGLVGRLDLETSGIMVRNISKSNSMYLSLRRIFW
jgi:16S rRNA U516 pseudouridylate synthase RsuA-like enzyme